MTLPPCFLVGSPRSGTTAAAEVLGRHPDIAHFYEPYFVWERYAPSCDDDLLSADHVSPKMAGYVGGEFARFARKARAIAVIDKSPENAFRIPAIRATFPDARFIHLVRDGIDATASIRREWQRRREAVESRSVFEMARLAYSMLARQPFWRNRLQALDFELRRRLASGNASPMNKAKWGGAVGWGPRFPGWREAWAGQPEIAFHALQWARSVTAAEKGLADVPADRQITVRYQDLVRQPDATLAELQAFLGVGPVSRLGSDLDPRSIGRGRRELGQRELEVIEATVGDQLRRFRDDTTS